MRLEMMIVVSTRLRLNAFPVTPPLALAPAFTPEQLLVKMNIILICWCNVEVSQIFPVPLCMPSHADHVTVPRGPAAVVQSILQRHASLRAVDFLQRGERLAPVHVPSELTLPMISMFMTRHRNVPRFVVATTAPIAPAFRRRAAFLAVRKVAVASVGETALHVFSVTLN